MLQSVLQQRSKHSRAYYRHFQTSTTGRTAFPVTAESPELHWSCQDHWTLLLNTLTNSQQTITSYTWCGMISGNPVTFCRNSCNYCPNLMILSALWTEIISVQAQTKICRRTVILLLHYLAETNSIVHNYRAPWLLFYKLSTNGQKLITFSTNMLC